MKLLIVTQYYPPESGAPQNRLHDLAVRLTKWGHEVQVLTAFPNYPGNSVFDGYQRSGTAYEVIDGVGVWRVGLYVPRKKTFLRRLGCYLSFAANARRRGDKLVGSADLVLLESPPLFLALAAVPLAKRLGARLVVNVSDLWPQSVVDLGMLKPGLALRCAELLESWMYSRADLITGQTEGILNFIRSKIPTKRTLLFPNGVDLEAYREPLLREKIRDEYGWPTETVVFGYAGVLGHAQALKQLIDAARLLGSTPRALIALFGDGPLREELIETVKLERLANVRIYPRVPREKMPHLQAAFDVGLVPLSKAALFEGARPSKMFEIMAAGRPILLCAKGEAARIVNGLAGAPVGLTVDPEAPAQLANAMKLLVTDADLRRRLGHRGAELVKAEFDRESIAKELEIALKDTLKFAS